MFSLYLSCQETTFKLIAIQWFQNPSSLFEECFVLWNIRTKRSLFTYNRTSKVEIPGACNGKRRFEIFELQMTKELEGNKKQHI